MTIVAPGVGSVSVAGQQPNIVSGQPQIVRLLTGAVIFGGLNNSVTNASASKVRVAIPAITTAVIDSRTGIMDRNWYRFLNNLYERTGGTEDNVSGVANAVISSAASAEAAQAAAAMAATVSVNNSAQIDAINQNLVYVNNDIADIKNQIP